MLLLQRLISTRLPRCLNSPKAPSATHPLRAHIHSRSAADRHYADYVQVQPSKDFNYEMASQEIVAVSQQSVQVVVAQKENAHPSVSKRLTAQQPRRKFRKPKAKPVTSTMTEQNGSEVQVTVTETETKKYKTPRQTKKQKKGEREAAATAATAEATTTAKTAKVSVPPAVIQITETIRYTAFPSHQLPY